MLPLALLSFALAEPYADGPFVVIHAAVAESDDPVLLARLDAEAKVVVGTARPEDTLSLSITPRAAGGDALELAIATEIAHPGARRAMTARVRVADGQPAALRQGAVFTALTSTLVWDEDDLLAVTEDLADQRVTLQRLDQRRPRARARALGALLEECG